MTSRIGVVAAAAAVFAAGCGSSGYQKKEDAGDSMSALKEELNKTKRQIDTTHGALQALVAGAGQDLKPGFQRYSSEVDALEGQIATSRSAAERMRARAAAYLDAWQEDSQKFTSEKYRNLSEERRNKSKMSFEKMSAAVDAAQAASDPLLSDSKDIRRFLGNDLTAGGVQAVADGIKRVGAEGDAVKSRIDGVLGEIDRVKAEFSSGGPAAK